MAPSRPAAHRLQSARLHGSGSRAAARFRPQRCLGCSQAGRHSDDQVRAAPPPRPHSTSWWAQSPRTQGLWVKPRTLPTIPTRIRGSQTMKKRSFKSRSTKARMAPASSPASSTRRLISKIADHSTNHGDPGDVEENRPAFRLRFSTHRVRWRR
jgi:hypothetical protein